MVIIEQELIKYLILRGLHLEIWNSIDENYIIHSKQYFETFNSIKSQPNDGECWRINMNE